MILTVKEQFKSDHISDILAGNLSSAVKSYRHFTIPEFGNGREKDNKFWNAVFRQALIARLIDKNIESYGLLFLTPKGHEYLKDPKSFMLSQDHDYEAIEDNSLGGGGGTSTVDPVLFSILKDQRKVIAKRHKLPPFVIFSDPSLEDMAINYPISIDELKNISGVGQGKAIRFGEEMVKLITKYVEEYEIERPQDMVVKSIVNKSGLKVYIIQNIDRQRSLADIAAARGLKMLDFMSELEAIVHSGTKINIKYYIDQVIDEDKQEDIYEYFMEDAETDSIEEALLELGEDEYSELDIRLVRVKFMSEMGN